VGKSRNCFDLGLLCKGLGNSLYARVETLFWDRKRSCSGTGNSLCRDLEVFGTSWYGTGTLLVWDYIVTLPLGIGNILL
jgi:hypothetical protein